MVQNNEGQERAIKREGNEIHIHAKKVRVVITEDVPGNSNAKAFWRVLKF